MTIKFDHTKIEKKWQDKWNKEKLYVADIKNGQNPFYNLWMFPYPSAEGLHAGHAFASTGSDIYGRFMRMNGHSVFQPFGYDSFGIHSENYAIKINENPHEVVLRTTRHYEEQMRSLGHGYDWTRTVTTSSPEYYRWTQWLFIEMFKAGLAYKKKANVNFCPSCKTVLADEQVMSPKAAGKEPKNAQGEVISDSEDLKVCERCGTVAEKRELDQWFFKITDYADRLLLGLEKIDWSERVKLAQKEWIGKKEGRIIKFGDIVIFTTRPETINSATFIAVSGTEDKFTGRFVVNPLNNKKIPVWEARYVLKDYGTGAIMGVPAYDDRDMLFAKENDIDIVKLPFKKNNVGKIHTTYHLRDWLVSRQRYWGAPIPMIWCDKCKWQVEENLPVLLPDIDDYRPKGEGQGPLAAHPEFYKTKCPKCGGEATRETDVMDTFVDSSWYFLRYPSVRSDTATSMPFDPEVTKRWFPVNLYFGGAEHSVLHLMYSRFVNMVMKDRGLVGTEEPFPKFFAHGLMIKDGAKMSKSRGNVVNPDEYIKKFGADVMRMYEMFLGPMDGNPDFRDSGIEGMERFLGRVWRLFQEIKDTSGVGLDSPEVLSKVHQTIKGVTEDIKLFKYNTAIAKIMELVNVLTNNYSLITNDCLKSLARLLAPFAPHMMEEVWVEVLHQPFSIHKVSWPAYDPKMIVQSEAVIMVQINGKVRSQFTVDSQESTDKKFVTKMAKEDEKIVKWLDGQIVKKTIFIPGKLINFVV